MISIIIPAYNVEKCVSRTIDSVLKQNIRDIEVIVVDDGSSDNTFEVIKRFAIEYPDRVKVFHKKNEGVTRARLYGVQKSHGEYIGFVDADDTIENNMYEILLGNIKENDADISHCGYKMIFNDGRIHKFHGTKQKIIAEKNEGIKMLLTGELVEPGLWNKLYKRELLDVLIESQVMDSSIRINEDLLMNYYLFSYADKTVFDDTCLYNYIVRDDSVSRTKLTPNRIYDPIKVKKIILDSIDSSMSDLAEEVYIKTCISIYNTVCINGDNEFNDDIRKIKKIIKSGRNYCKSKRENILVQMILHLPVIVYKCIYNTYAKRLMKNVYE